MATDSADHSFGPRRFSNGAAEAQAPSAKIQMPGSQMVIVMSGRQYSKVKVKLSELIDALYTENAQLHCRNRELMQQNIALSAELFYLSGQLQPSAPTSEEIDHENKN